jgi:ribosomal protein L11 methyltransferase
MLREFRIHIDAASAESLSDALLDAGALSVSVEDADADGTAEEPLYGEPGLTPTRHAWRRNRLVVLVDAATDIPALISAAAAAAAEPCPDVESVRDVDDEDWVRKTQQDFPPTAIGRRLWIVPTWHEPPDPSAVVIRLDPGVAFGTGTHPTTRLVLEWLDAHPPENLSVLDYGCGSGILAIAAGKLGAHIVFGTDIDPQALEAARANAASNGVAAVYTAPDDLPAHPFDLVLANILTNPLKLLAPLLLARVAPRGQLVLAGILERQADDVIETYTRIDARLHLVPWRSADGWMCLTGMRAE